MSGYPPRDTGRRMPPLPNKIERIPAHAQLVETPPVFIYPYGPDGYDPDRPLKESEIEDKRDLRDPWEVGNEILAKHNGGNVPTASDADVDSDSKRDNV